MSRISLNGHRGIVINVYSIITKKRIKYCLTAAILIAAVVIAHICWKDGLFLPRWIDWNEKAISDSSGKYEITLNKRKVRVTHDGEYIWESPDNIRVQDVCSADIDFDGGDELLLLCWKTGRYGDANPFWTKNEELENDKWSQHLFVYEYREDKIKAKWMSSYLGADVEVMSIEKLEDKGARVVFTSSKGIKSVWQWGSWGFARVD